MLYKAFLDLTAPPLQILGGDDPAGAANGLIKGYASVFNTWDRQGEWIEPGAHAPHLPSFLKEGLVAWDHDWGQPIATPVEAYEDGYGLFCVAEFHSHAAAQEKRQIAAERLARGKTMGHSIGYEVLADAPGTQPDGTRGRKLLDVPIFEYSLVTVPANRWAGATDVKGGLPAGWPYAEQADAALAVVADFVTRTQLLAELRRKDGRVLSAVNRGRLSDLQARLTDCATLIGDLLAETAPAPSKADPAAVRAALAAVLVADAARKELRIL